VLSFLNDAFDGFVKLRMFLRFFPKFMTQLLCIIHKEGQFFTSKVKKEKLKTRTKRRTKFR
jgi:hypothetical protein